MTWFFWQHLHTGWTCLGYVHAPHAAAVMMARWNGAGTVVKAVGTVKACA